MRRAIVIGVLVAGALLVLAPGASARPSLSTYEAKFEPQALLTTSTAQTFTLRVVCNVDPANPDSCFNSEPFTPAFDTTGDFAVLSEDCPPTLPGATAFGMTCQIQVVFKPTVSGDRTGLFLTGSDFARAALSGIGIQPICLCPPRIPVVKKCKKPKKKRAGAAAKKKCKPKKKK